MRFTISTVTSRLLAYLALSTTLVATAIPVSAEVVYTPVHVSIPVNSNYNVDLNADGTADFTLTSKLIQAYCQAGDEYIWNLTVTAATGNAVMVEPNHIGSTYAEALAAGVQVNSSQTFYPGTSIMADLFWGNCGIGAMGEWLNSSNQYLGVYFRDSNGGTHYGWVQLSTAAYVDRYQHVQTSIFVSGYAYETVAGQGILAGQKSDES